MKKKIALVGNSAQTMYNFRSELMSDLLAANYQVTVIAPADCDISIYKKIGVEFVAVEMDCRGTNPIKDYKLIQRLEKIYKKEQFDFIFHYTIKPVIYGSFAAKRAKTKQISVITGLGYTFIQKGLLNHIARTLYGTALKSVQEVWFLNQDDKSLFINLSIVPENKCQVINGEGINVDSFNCESTPKKPFQFLYIGRMLWDKGIGEYVEAAKELRSKYPDVDFALLGPLNSQNPSAIDASQIKAWHEAKIINYLGETRVIQPYIEAASCVVLPSYREGISRVLLEACSMKRPIVTTNTTGCRDIVEDGRNGFLCEPKNSVQLARAMEKMLQQSEKELLKMGEEGRKVVLEKFDQRIISQTYLDTLSRLFN